MGRTEVVESTAEAEPEVDQPGLSRLREAVANRLPHLPGRSSLRDDGLAGLNSAVASVPDGLASGLLAGVNPIYGLYACMAGPIAGGLFSSTQLLIVATTSASSLAAGQALGGLSSPARDNALFVMVLLIGAFQIVFGLLRLGRLARFVSYSVMTGFLTGIAVLTVLSQLPTVTGYEATGSNRVMATLDLLLNLGQVDPRTVAIAGFTLALAVLLPRTRLGNFGNLVAIILPSLVAVLFSLESVQVVQDVGEIPRGLPTPFIPSLSLISLDVITGALAVAVIVLIQGAGVSQSVPNPDGSRTRASRDFIAQGAANVASGLFRGLPVGGSLSTTALSVLSGARTRWAAIFAGLWMAAVVVALSGVVAQIAMPALAVLLIVASASAIKPAEVRSIWNTGWPSRLAIVTTFLATLFLPIQAAVGIGVVLSAVLYLYTSSADISVVELVERPDGRIEERKPPKHLHSNSVTVLDIYGHLFYAGARTLARLLPRPGDAENLVVILRLRGRTTVGATLIDELSAYANQLAEANGRLYLTGLSEDVYDQMVRNGKLREADPVQAYKASPVVGESTHRAYVDAQTWLVNTSDEDVPGVPPPDATNLTVDGRPRVKP
jgi:sulfate permease, SulP family